MVMTALLSRLREPRVIIAFSLSQASIAIGIAAIVKELLS